MLLEALLTAFAISLISLVGVFFFGHDKRLIGAERFIVPIAVGVFLSLVIYELIPETLSTSPSYGALAIFVGFISFYITSNILHKRFHATEDENCDKKGAAMLLIIGNTIHHLSDGFIIGGAFLISPTAGFAVALGIALHEIPQEIVEFGVLVRAGYTRTKAALLNFISATSITAGTLLIMLIAKEADGYIWILTGFAAGNLLYLAASDLLPRIHGDLKNYGTIWQSTTAIIIGFAIMSGLVLWSHHSLEVEASDAHGIETTPEGVCTTGSQQCFEVS